MKIQRNVKKSNDRASGSEKEKEKKVKKRLTMSGGSSNGRPSSDVCHGA